jgi:hypothetical protein
MRTIKQSEFDELVTHTIRIELKDGTVVQYRLSKEAKETLWNCLTSSDLDYSNPFVWLYAQGDRIVFINRKEIVRLTFCFDMYVGEESFYFDNFGNIEDDLLDDEEAEENITEAKNTEETVAETQENQWKTEKQAKYLSQLVIKHKGKEGGYFGNPSFYSSLNDGGFVGLEIDPEEKVCIVSDFINFIDDDGEENFIPVENLILVELERKLLLDESDIEVLIGKKVKQPIKKRARKK